MLCPWEVTVRSYYWETKAEFTSLSDLLLGIQYTLHKNLGKKIMSTRRSPLGVDLYQIENSCVYHCLSCLWYYLSVWFLHRGKLTELIYISWFVIKNLWAAKNGTSVQIYRPTKYWFQAIYWSSFSFRWNQKFEQQQKHNKNKSAKGIVLRTLQMRICVQHDILNDPTITSM